MVQPFPGIKGDFMRARRTAVILMIFQSWFCTSHAQASTCPNLSGKFLCPSERRAKTFTITQKIVKKVTQFRFETDDVVTQIQADGFPYNFIGAQNGVSGTTRHICNGEALQNSTAAVISHVGLPEQKWQTDQFLSLNSQGNLAEKTVVQMTVNGAKQQSSESTICVREP
jgi:hypothetical protein